MWKCNSFVLILNDTNKPINCLFSNKSSLGEMLHGRHKLFKLTLKFNLEQVTEEIKGFEVFVISNFGRSGQCKSFLGTSEAQMLHVYFTNCKN